MKVAVAGFSGAVGRVLVSALLAHDAHQPRAIVRQESTNRVLEGIEVALIDFATACAGDFRAAVDGCDAIVFTAGAGGRSRELTEAVDGRAVAKLIHAARRTRIDRFVLVSAYPDAWRDRPMSEDFEHCMKMKRLAGVDLAASPLNWVIVRPGTPTDDEPAGLVRVGRAIPYASITRGDVAALLLAVLDRPDINREIIEVTAGSMEIGRALDDFSS